MRAIAGGILFLLPAFQAFAENLPIQAADVLSAMAGYQDSNYYRAVLVNGTEGADLYIFTRQNDKSQQAVYARDIVFTGIGGIDARLTQKPDGTLQIISENVAIGRHRWKQKLTIVYRGNQFLVGGFTYSYSDTITTDSAGNLKTGKCDLNLLTGRGVKDNNPIRAAMKAIAVQNWTLETFPSECEYE